MYNSSDITLRSKKQIRKNLAHIVPGIKDLYVMESAKPGLITVSIELPWWKWTIPFLISYIYKKKVENAFFKFGTVGILYSIKML